MMSPSDSTLSQPRRCRPIIASLFTHRDSQDFIVRETSSAASCSTKWSASGMVTSVRSRWTKDQLSFNACASNALSFSPWISPRDAGTP